VLGAEQEIKETYVKQGQVRLIFNPNLAHGDRSLQTHHAAECAAEQDTFWALHDLMYRQQQELFSGDIRGAVKGFGYELGLDTGQYIDCIDQQRYVALVQDQDKQRQQLAIRQLPTLDINGELVVGPQAFETLQAIIEPMLAAENSAQANL
jgi:protein-disulfide isomerase